MIISHRHRFIFFAVPKTATHAIREVLRAHKGEQDWEQQMLFGEQSIPIPEVAAIKHGHIAVRDIEPLLPIEQWQTYFKLAFVRNPFDRFVSACAFLNRGNPAFARDPLSWMTSALQRQQFRQRVLIQPQVRQLSDEHGNIAMDFIGRYESLQASLDEVLAELSLPKQQLNVRNHSEHGRYQEYYDASLRAQVAELYADDLECLEYSF